MQYDLYILYNWNSAELNASCAYIMDTMVIIVTAMITMVIGNSHGYHGYYGNNHGYYLLGAALVTMVNMTCNTILTTVSIIA